MADVYGSTLDSMMANKIAQQGAQQAEANSYRNFLNQVSNTNLRRREGEALDRRGMEEMAINRMNVAGLNDYRRGQVDIGMEDARTRRYEGETGRENVRGLNTYRGGQIEIGKTDAGTRAYDAATTRDWRIGQNAIDAERVAAQKEVGLTGISANREVGLEGIKASVTNTNTQAGANMFDSANRLEAASLDYNKLRRGEQLAFDQGGIEGLKQFRAANNPANENLRLMREADQLEEAKMRRSAYASTMDKLNADFEDEAVGWGSWELNSPRTDEIIRERERIMSKKPKMNEDDAYQEALATVSRRIVDSRFGARPPVNEILRNDRYDVKPDIDTPDQEMSVPQTVSTNSAPNRVFIPRGRGIQRPVQRPATGNWPPNE